MDHPSSNKNNLLANLCHLSFWPDLYEDDLACIIPSHIPYFPHPMRSHIIVTHRFMVALGIKGLHFIPISDECVDQRVKVCLTHIMSGGITCIDSPALTFPSDEFPRISPDCLGHRKQSATKRTSGRFILVFSYPWLQSNLFIMIDDLCAPQPSNTLCAVSPTLFSTNSRPSYILKRSPSRINAFT